MGLLYVVHIMTRHIAVLPNDVIQALEYYADPSHYTDRVTSGGNRPRRPAFRRRVAPACSAGRGMFGDQALVKGDVFNADFAPSIAPSGGHALV